MVACPRRSLQLTKAESNSAASPFAMFYQLLFGGGNTAFHREMPRHTTMTTMRPWFLSSTLVQREDQVEGGINEGQPGTGP